jgi:hypothetical protein
MLTIQKISIKDLAGREYQTDRLVLTLRDQAEIHSLRGNDQYLFVRFVGTNHPFEHEISTMCDRASDLMVQANVLWPERICYDRDTDVFCGFLAKTLPIPFKPSTLDSLLCTPLTDPPDTVQKLTIGHNLAKCIHTVHQATGDHVFGVPHPEDFYVTPEGQVLFCYAYRHTLDTHSRLNSIYSPPEYRTTPITLSTAGDAYSFSMMLFLLLVGKLPFGAHAPQTEFSEAQICDMILNGESIYYYANAPQTLEIDQMLISISPDLSNLFRLTFDYCGLNQYDAERPTMTDWVTTLEKMLKK